MTASRTAGSGWSGDVAPFHERVLYPSRRPFARAWARGDITMTQARNTAFANAPPVEGRFQRPRSSGVPHPLYEGEILELVLDDQRLRNEACSSVFDR